MKVQVPFHYFMPGGSCRFCFTLNNYTDESVEWFENTDLFKYVCFGKEVGESLTPHLQGYFEFAHGNRKSIKACKDLLIANGLQQQCHLEVARAVAADCIKYCEKDGVFWEKGSRPVGSGKRCDLDAVAKSISDGSSLQEVADLHPAEFIKYSRGIERLITMKRLTQRRDWKTEVFWLWGPSGSGKSRWAWQTYPEAYMKQAGTKWWCHYEGQESAIIDDFRPSKEMPFNFILNLFDRYPLLLETKGGQVPCLLKTIVVTSPFSPEQMLSNLEWVGIEAGQQLKRRLDHVIQFPQLAMMFQN